MADIEDTTLSNTGRGERYSHTQDDDDIVAVDSDTEAVEIRKAIGGRSSATTDTGGHEETSWRKREEEKNPGSEESSQPAAWPVDSVNYLVSDS